jgi:hypothetical protein
VEQAEIKNAETTIRYILLTRTTRSFGLVNFLMPKLKRIEVILEQQFPKG